MDLQTFYNRNDKKAKQGLLSEVQIAEIQNQAIEKERQIIDFREFETMKIEDEAHLLLEEITLRIEDHAQLFSRKNGIDILLVKTAGGLITYIESSLDVTGEFITFVIKMDEEK